jgi:hypothetical protein
MAMIGPGALSFYAWLFGWKRIDPNYGLTHHD